jgi:hypothetical protein
MTSAWETLKERVARGAKISPLKKLEALRAMNEFSDAALTKSQKTARRKLKRAS